MVSYQTEDKKGLFNLPEGDLKPYQRKFVNNVNLAKNYISEHNYSHLLKYIEKATTIEIDICHSVSFKKDSNKIKSYSSILTSVINNPYITFSSFKNEPQIIINEFDNHFHIPVMAINLTCISDYIITDISDKCLQLFFNYNYGEDGYRNMFIINIKCD